MLISSVFSASNLPMAVGFRRKAEKLGLEEGKPDFRVGGPESRYFNRYSLNSSGGMAHGPNHWGCCCLESDDSVCNSVDVCRIHIGKGRRIGQLQPR